MIEPDVLLDRYELLYPDDTRISDLRRAVVDQDLASIFRLSGSEYDELRKAVMEKNMHSIFRLLGDQHDELRKAVIEQNLFSIFRLVEEGIMLGAAGITPQDWTDSKLNLRKAICNENISSLFKIIDYEDLRKAVTLTDPWSIFRILADYTDTNFTTAFKTLMRTEHFYDADCFSRGQLESKLWLVRELNKLPVDLGTVFLCAGWYGTLATMLFESGARIEKIRSFDIDPLCAPIAEIFNKPWVMQDWRFKAVTEDIMGIDYREHHYTVNRSDGSTCGLRDFPDTIINTSMEHIPNYSEWWRSIPKGKLMIVQCNDYEDLEEHISTASSLDEFDVMTPVTNTLFLGELKLEKYSRFMKIGYK